MACLNFSVYAVSLEYLLRDGMRLSKRGLIVLLPVILLLTGCYQQAGQALPQQSNLTVEPVNSGVNPTATQSIAVDTGGDSSTSTTPQLAITVISPTREIQVSPTSLSSGDNTSAQGSDNPLPTLTPQQFITPLTPLDPFTTATPVILQTPLATASGLVTPTAFSDANSLGTCTHTVQPGDTLYRISLKYEISVEELRNANPEVSGDLIQPGQTLKIPDCEPSGSTSVNANTTVPPTQRPVTTPGSGTTYTVQSGDTLFNIAQRFGVTVKAIQDANSLANPNRLSIGQELIIPPPSG